MIMNNDLINICERIFVSNKISYEIINHAQLSVPYIDTVAEALSIPKRMVVKAVCFKYNDTIYTALIPGDCSFDVDSTSKYLQTTPEKIILSESTDNQNQSQLSILDIIENSVKSNILIDAKLFELSYVIFLSGDATKSVRIDARNLISLKFKMGLFSKFSSTQADKLGFEILLERGFIERTTDEKRGRELLGDTKTSIYIGFDPTADSLHVGSLVPIMALTNLQRAGHPIIAIIGGATALIGDPSGKTEMRKMLTPEKVEENLQGIKKQLSSFLVFDNKKGKVINNADWFINKGYLEFLREVGPYFSVNKMLTAECFKSRMDKGLSFIEFNYMLLQAYDFLMLSQKEDCLIQMGGSDQWGNICAGVDLTRRMAGLEVAGITFPLLMNSSGKKFGKTEQGNIWLDPNKTSPYEYFQFWRNTEDNDIRKFLQLFTFIPIETIREMTSTEFSINTAKKILAFTATSLAHGDNNAIESSISAESLFGGNPKLLAEDLKRFSIINNELYNKFLEAIEKSKSAEAITQLSYTKELLQEGVPILDVLINLGFADSKSAARRLIDQGGVQINNKKLDDVKYNINCTDFDEQGTILIKAGKKRFGKVILSTS